MIQLYSRVQLIGDKYKEDGACNDMIGYVIETYGDGKYEVEFSTPQGISLAQLVIDEKDLRLAPEPQKEH
ncbi:MAG TPA: DUF4926 domain-containing protein [Luteolibacter sp.]